MVHITLPNGMQKKAILKTYSDYHVMCKSLTIFKNSLAAGTEPPIDYDLLRSKHINLLGKELEF